MVTVKWEGPSVGAVSQAQEVAGCKADVEGAADIGGVSRRDRYFQPFVTAFIGDVMSILPNLVPPIG